MDENWASIEAQMIRKLCLKAPKFGNDIDEVDELVKDVFDSYLELLPNYTTLRTGKGPEVSCYTMSTSNITSYVPNGFVVGATPDGRMAGSPLNEGCSPTQGTDKHGPTAVILCPIYFFDATSPRCDYCPNAKFTLDYTMQVEFYLHCFFTCFKIICVRRSSTVGSATHS